MSRGQEHRQADLCLHSDSTAAHGEVQSLSYFMGRMGIILTLVSPISSYCEDKVRKKLVDT